MELPDLWKFDDVNDFYFLFALVMVNWIKHIYTHIIQLIILLVLCFKHTSNCLVHKAIAWLNIKPLPGPMFNAVKNPCR